MREADDDSDDGKEGTEGPTDEVDGRKQASGKINQAASPHTNTLSR